MNTIQEDERTILRAYVSDEVDFDVRVNCSHIEPYQEKGVGDFMTVLAVKNYSGDIVVRIPAWKADIYYV